MKLFFIIKCILSKLSTKDLWKYTYLYNLTIRSFISETTISEIYFNFRNEFNKSLPLILFLIYQIPKNKSSQPKTVKYHGINSNFYRNFNIATIYLSIKK